MLAVAAERHPSILFGAMAMVSVAAAGLLVRGQGALPLPLIGLAGLALILLMLSVRPTSLFIGWLFLAPLLDGSTASPVGKPLGLALYALPGLVLAVLTFTQPSRGASISVVDFLPAAYVAYAITSIVVTSPVLEPTTMRTLEVVFLNLVLGPCIYYFLVFGPGAGVETPKIFFVLMIGACMQGVLALLDAGTSWNLWGYDKWNNADGEGLRAVSTFTNPGVLGAYLGIGVITAVTALTWSTPDRLRRLAPLTLVICIPGLLATLTRGPVAATAVAVLLVVFLSRKRVLAVAGVACMIVALVVAWPHIRNSSVYQQRASNVETVQVREALQKVSIQLWREKPVLGWGFGSYNRVKNNAEFPYVQGLPGRIYLYARENTSHNTYLTVLVELGLVGGILLFGPFVVVVARALRRARSIPTDRWIVAAAGGSLVIVMLTGMTLDYRFFSFVPALSFVMLALLRRLSDDWRAGAAERSIAAASE